MVNVSTFSHNKKWSTNTCYCIEKATQILLILCTFNPSRLWWGKMREKYPSWFQKNKQDQNEETFPESWGSCWKLKWAWGLDHNVETIIISLCEGLVLVPWKMVLILGKTYWRVFCAVGKVSTLYRHWRFSVHLKLLVNKLLFKTIVSIKGEKTMSFAIEAKLYPDPSHPKWWCNSLLYDFTYFKRALGEDYISSHCVLGAVDDPDVVEQISNSSFPYQITKKKPVRTKKWTQ